MEREDAFQNEHVWRVQSVGLFDSGMLLEGVDGYLDLLAFFDLS